MSSTAKPFTHIGLFEGIGGFSYAAKQMGWITKAWCEWNEFGQKVLRYHYPEAEGHGDITKTDFTKYANTIDLVSGGFPCQPYSLAGKRKGKDDERHLWPEMLRAIREIRPRWVVGENVFGLINWSNGLVFHEVQADLEAEGYEVWPYVLPACAVNAPHRRDRVWFVAYASNNGYKNRCEETRGQNGCSEPRRMQQFERMGEQRATTYTNIEQREQAQGRFQPEPVNGSKGLNTHTHSDGCEWCNSQHEKHTSERGQYAQHDIEQNDIANCTCSSSTGQLQQQQGQEQFRGCHCQPNATNTNGRRQPSEEHGQAQPGWATETSIRNNWQNFPTQSPICDGNDGISTRLHGITFPKWRNESIKAAGNAIVPQIALMIFKAIQEYEELQSL